MSSFTETLKVDNQDMEIYVSMPDGTGPFPGVVVAQHAGGVDTFICAMADRLAEAGYVAAAPDLYHRLGPDDPRGSTRTYRRRDDRRRSSHRSVLTESQCCQ